ncbi:MAG: hrcA, partial [Paenibacillaceae bacterium]|nr:hrcA [Paenibacillaceae bacterium]
MLTERQRKILSAIVDDYIRSAEPVGSRSISKRGDVGFSPATIRNEMSDLEELGYLEQPHTSAGRIPSHLGYRYYVDHLLKTASLSGQEFDVIKLFFAEKIHEMEQVIQQVAMILSNLTHYTSIVLGPE